MVFTHTHSVEFKELDIRTTCTCTYQHRGLANTEDYTMECTVHSFLVQGKSLVHSVDILRGGGKESNLLHFIEQQGYQVPITMFG